MAPAARRPRISVVIPTFQRREQVLAALASLSVQRFDQPWDVVVVVDGSTDGTAAAVRAAPLPVPVHVVEQPNGGLSRARNAGAAAATGELVLYLDDDMEAHPDLLCEHDRAHRLGADVVMGRIPMHPDTPDTLTADLTTMYVDGLHGQLGDQITDVRWNQLVGGQMSVARQVVLDSGGFDPDCFGVEDWELGYRLARAGHRLVYNPDAISWQRYTVSHTDLVEKYRRNGAADAAMVAKHPELADAVFVEAWRRQGRAGQVAKVAGLHAPAALLAVVHRAALSAVARGGRGLVARRLLGLSNTVAYWQGVRATGAVAIGGDLRGRARARLRPQVHRLRRLRAPARWGNLRRRRPFTDNFGFARGTPVDRRYIEDFLAAHRADIRGDVLEVGRALYTHRFGAPGVRSHVVDVDPANPTATIVGDLQAPGVLGAEAFDCIVLTQTLQYFDDPPVGLATVVAALRPGGVLLLTAPSLSPVDSESYLRERWRFTPAGVRDVVSRAAPGASIEVTAHGNLVVATAFVQGLAAEDLRPDELDVTDERFAVVVTARVQRPRS